MKINVKMLRSLVKLLIVIGILIIVNTITSKLFIRFDLTAEKRYTISTNSKEFLKLVEDEIIVDLYLEGDLNAGFRNLASATRDMLDELDVYVNEGLTYERINPNSGTNKEKKVIYSELKTLKCEPVPVYEAAEDGRNSQMLVFPYAVIHYNDKTTVVNLLDNITGYSGLENLNKSIEGLEYKLMMGIRKLVETEKPRIAFLEGHGELDEMEVMDASSALSEFYNVERGVIGNDPSILDPYKVLIVAKPSKRFSESDKFIIDQYIMNGGAVLWLLDAVNITLDSLQYSSQTYGLMSDFNLRDQLFKYGIRINPEIIEDVQAARIQINGAPAGQPPRLVAVPWLFNPLLLPNENASLTRNINMVKGEFVSTIDTVGDDLKISRIPLLSTSKYTKINKVPVFVTLALVNEQPVRREFNKSYLPVAYAQEGVFPSVFQNRMIPQGILMNDRHVKTESEPTRMIVVADGDVVKNKVRYRNVNPQIVPLGFDEASGQNFGNKEFIVNAVSYLADDNGWMELRSRDYKMRLLDKEKLSRGVLYWKLINVLLPAVLIIVMGLILRYIRFVKYVK
ncbi:MAG: gliding motility-associated ABC transporter substrate-binding protein GldG [Marinilabiliaceae bacterium]|nr:gliding motility-associated ABC transporter substrate-binding protein GldG [Marinilabiliaceae bacterium]